MKICHVTSAHNRYDGRIFLKQCKSLSKKYDVSLLCCDDLDDEIKDNVKIISTHHKFKNRYDRMLNSNKVLKRKCLEINADVYQFHDADLLSLALYMKKKGKKVIFDSHEDYVALLLEREWVPKMLRKPLSKIYEVKEKRVLKKIDYVICAPQHIIKRIRKINKNAEIITNYPIIDENVSKKNESKENILIFAGGIRSDWNHEVVIKAIQDIPNIKYYLIGSCSKEYYEKLKELDQNKKVQFFNKMPFSEVKKMYTKANMGIALCSYRPNVNYKEGSLGNTKIFEFMMYELPVIFTDFVCFKNINKESQYGISVNPYDVNEVKAAIEYLIKNKKEAEKYGKNGRKLVETKYNWKEQEKVLFQIYDKISK